MDRRLFEEKMTTAPTTVDKDLFLNTIINSMTNTPVDIGRGTQNLVICMEELSELQQAISKYLRGKEDHMGIVEEMADVILAMSWVKRVCNITDEELSKALNVKAERLRKNKL